MLYLPFRPTLLPIFFAFFNDDLCCVFNLNIVQATSIEAATDLEQAARAVDSDDICAGSDDVVDLLFEDWSRHFREFNGVRTTEAAAFIAIVHFDEFDTLGSFQEFTLFLGNAEVTVQVAGIVIGDLHRYAIAGIRQAAEHGNEFAEVEGLAAEFFRFFEHFRIVLEEVDESRRACVQVGQADTM